MEDTEIKRCPHCGGKASLNSAYSYKIRNFFVYVKCDICGAQGKSFLTAENPAAEDWNSGPCRDALNAWNMRHTGQEV